MSEQVEQERKPLHGAVLVIERHTFEQMLDLPPDVHVVAVYQDQTRAGLVLHLVGDSLPEVREGYTPKHADISLRMKRDDDGIWWRQMAFDVRDD